MRLQFSRSWDFNQMLVASVFAHFMFMTLVLFIPQTVTHEKVIKPALMVQLVERPTGQKKNKFQKKRRPEPKRKTKSEVKKNQPKLPPVPPKPKVAAKPKFQPKVVAPISESLKFDPLPPPSMNQPDASQKILDQLDRLDGKKPPGLIEELDQLAKLQATKPPKKKVAVSKPIPLEKDKVREVDVTHPKKLDPKQLATLPAPVRDPLDDFDQLKMKSELEPDNPEPVVNNEVPEKKVSALKDLEFAALEKPTLEYQKRKKEKSAADLLKELTELETLRPPVTQNSKTSAFSQEASLDTDAGDVELILKKLDSLEVVKKEVKIDVTNQKTLAMEFESDIWKVQVPKTEAPSASSAAAIEGGTFSPGEPDPDILAQYIGLVRQKVYKKWYEPLGKKYNNKEVVVLLTIYSKGNIDRPKVNNSSGVDILDTLAVRAVMEAEPFPEFPNDLKSPNLNITIHFKYVQEN